MLHVLMQAHLRIRFIGAILLVVASETSSKFTSTSRPILRGVAYNLYNALQSCFYNMQGLKAYVHMY